ncbi:hypothetical protein G7B40_006075 [Aetokthonos hydrillicola Thurmond2011]|jgi:hypothetical protein|uniref:Uncharacterized protein n=1 Tax=Aetokthonos hydrillicola Thurmond2011 TaxID=2712845 RepID=A0AAP5M8Z5_9CYAN|nr:hypothetical protein [Aetokthonos hydrillicola]MBO3462200.1 hypothetical protein [Aetokthonos hydrillicola CCALA 1050]MBW4585102.1 hypothetical protein [Aetokthonos hydrillicola CCALA 1050]MDR9894138.1 hypothetical protein [Aetokthonos hydrillicola Thurmond2011]
MKRSRRSIFRDDAVRRYVESREKSVLPRLVSPRMFIYLWFLLGLLLISSIVAWFSKVPVYASGSAVVVRWKSKKNTSGNIVVAAFFPPQYLPKLQTAQKLFLHFDGMSVNGASRGENRLERSVIFVKPEISSPDVVHKQFALDSGAAQNITQPVAAVVAQLEPISTGLTGSTYLGSVGRADVEVGKARAVSLLPLIGHFFEQ